MRIWIALPIAMILFISSWFVYFNPEIVDTVIENTNNVDDEEYFSLNIQSEEKWLVLVIGFQDKKANSEIDLEMAKSLINGENGVSNYLTEMSAGESSFNFEFHSSVLNAEYSVSEYGVDVDGIRDAGTESSDGANGLAIEAFTQASNNGVVWGDFDLNSDGVVDRLLILHTGGVQEDGGNSNELWSHFGHFENDLKLNESTIKTYAMAGLKSNVGTIAHEMLHSFGAADLYAVHDELPQDNWKGVGDFDIMASGNWAENNLGESRPVLPMAATLNLIGLDRFEEIQIEEIGSNNEVQFELIPMSNLGIAYRIELSHNEFIWLENRHQSGLDSELPGSGLLVSIEDKEVGNISLNNVNRDSLNPYLQIIEADGNSGLISGSNSGESSDLFVNGSKFGNEGLEIRERYGELVPWSIEIKNLTDEKIILTLKTNELPIISIVSYATEFLDGEPYVIDIETNSNCNLNAELFSDDSRILRLESELEVGLNEVYGVWDSPRNSDSGQIFGIIKCGDSNQLNVKFNWKSIGNRIDTDYFEGTIHFEEVSEVVIPLEFEGNDSRTYQLEYVGPLERIAKSPSEVTLSPGDELVVTIDPNGLLSPGMYARGHIVLHDGLYEYEIEVVLQSEFLEGQSVISKYIGSPGQLIAISLALGGLWFLLSISTTNKNEIKTDEDEQDNIPVDVYY